MGRTKENRGSHSCQDVTPRPRQSRYPFSKWTLFGLIGLFTASVVSGTGLPNLNTLSMTTFAENASIPQPPPLVLDPNSNANSNLLLTTPTPEATFTTFNINFTTKHAIITRVNTRTDLFPPLDTDAPARTASIQFVATSIPYGKSVANENNQTFTPPPPQVQETSTCCLVVTLRYQITLSTYWIHRLHTP